MTATAALAPGEIRTHTARINGTDIRLTIKHVGTGHVNISKRVDGVHTQGWTEASETAALHLWADLLRTHQADEQTTTVQLGGVEVTLTCDTVAGRTRAYVETRQGGVVEAWTNTYDNRGDAVKAWRRACGAFRAHGTEQAIERQRNDLAIELAEQKNRQRRRMHNQARMDAIVRELDCLADLNDHYAALAAA